jgi:hypothetical protein
MGRRLHGRFAQAGSRRGVREVAIVSGGEVTQREESKMATEKKITEKTETEFETSERLGRPGTEGDYRKTTTKVERKEETEDKPTVIVEGEE